MAGTKITQLRPYGAFCGRRYGSFTRAAPVAVTLQITTRSASGDGTRRAASADSTSRSAAGDNTRRGGGIA